MKENTAEKEKMESEIYKSLIYLFRLFVKESDAGRYCLFSESHILEGEINPDEIGSASSLEEGLHSLGKSIYLALTGHSEDRDRSIKIDGYPKLEIFFWPILEILLSKDKPTIEKVEEKIKEVEERLKRGKVKDRQVKELTEKVVSIFGDTDIGIFEEAVAEARKSLYAENRSEKKPALTLADENGKFSQKIKNMFVKKPDPEESAEESSEGRDAQEFLDEVFEWLERNKHVYRKENWRWRYTNDFLIDMNFKGPELEQAGFIHKSESIIKKAGKEKRGWESLKKELKGKRIISVRDEHTNYWYLQILN